MDRVAWSLAEVSELASKSPHVFLERYGDLLSHEDVQHFAFLSLPAVAWMDPNHPKSPHPK
eukprot:2928419-Amphidinium_carterae.1